MSGKKPGINKIIRNFVKQLEEKVERLEAESVEAEQRGYAKAMEAERKDADQRIREAAEAERERCIHHIYGQCGSDNVAQRTVDAIRKGGER